MDESKLPVLRDLLAALGEAIQTEVRRSCQSSQSELSAVADETQADTIYAIDKVSEKTISAWFLANWPKDEPVEIIMEGLPDGESLCFPEKTNVEETRWKCILDPIDGTRGIMYDKRSAWALAGLAPQMGDTTALSDIVVAVMTEIPTTRAWRADQISAIRGQGLQAWTTNVLTLERTPLHLRTSQAGDFRHGFASLVKFFPEGRTLTAQIEEQLWDRLIGLGSSKAPVVFDDQYISTGGQFYELLCGHDRMVGDLRPLILDRLGYEDSLTCHPYDMAAALLLTEAGVILEHPLGGPVDALLDTTSPVTWIAFANAQLAAQARPVLQEILTDMLS